MCRKTNITGLVVITLLLSNVSFAHNKVVVIPLAGDDVVQNIKPFAPVTATSPATSDYTIRALTVIDNITQLEWQRIDDNVTRNWNDAFDYCVGLDLDGKTDWRLPTVNELQSIVDYGVATTPSINGVAFPSTNSAFYWSASASASSSSRALGVYFGGGFVDSDNKLWITKAMAYENLPIYRDAMQLAVYMEKAVGHFSRADKYQIGADLRQQSRRLATVVLSANYAVTKPPH